MTLLNTINSPATAAVIGASGGIGRALVEQLSKEPAISRIYACSRDASNSGEEKIQPLPILLFDEGSIQSAVDVATEHAPLDIVFVASGMLHRDEAIQPEKTMRDLSPRAMSEIFNVNAIGPTLIAKHFLPAMRKRRKTVFAVLSARVGSISDNRLGGWLSYRASKAALNMAVKTLSIEHARRHPESIVVALHPGTVDTTLSQPFSKRVASESLFSTTEAATYLIRVIDGLKVGDTGGFYAWDGTAIEY